MSLTHEQRQALRASLHWLEWMRHNMVTVQTYPDDVTIDGHGLDDALDANKRDALLTALEEAEAENKRLGRIAHEQELTILEKLRSITHLTIENERLREHTDIVGKWLHFGWVTTARKQTKLRSEDKAWCRYEQELEEIREALEALAPDTDVAQGRASADSSPHLPYEHYTRTALAAKGKADGRSD